MDNQIPENSSDEHTETNIGRNVLDSIVIAGSGNVINVSGRNAPKKVRRPAKSKKSHRVDKAIVIALIGVAGTIIAALLTSPLLEKWTESTPMLTAIPTEANPVIVVVTSTEAPVTLSTPTFPPISEDTAAVSPSPVSKVDIMTAILQSTVDEGKAPLRSNFDARASYAKFADGSMASCGNNRLCFYTFAIYRDSKYVERFSNNDGMLSYTFGGRGKYFITVYVCRGETCNDDGVTVNVK